MFKNLLIALFGAPSVDAAIGKFNKALTDLKAVADHHDMQAALHQEAAALSARMSSVAATEAARARVVAARIEAIVA